MRVQRLFVYGSLQPGEANENMLTAIGGDWERGCVKGTVVDGGWSTGTGYRGLLLDDDGDDVQGHVFVSPHLHAAWDDLDRFEGDDYKRVTTAVVLADGVRVDAFVYVLRSP